MFRDRLLNILASFNLNEAEKLLKDIYLHKHYEDQGSLLSLEEEKLYEQLLNITDEYKKYH